MGPQSARAGIIERACEAGLSELICPWKEWGQYLIDAEGLMNMQTVRTIPHEALAASGPYEDPRICQEVVVAQASYV